MSTETATQNTVKVWYEMSEGSHQKMYTLWHCTMIQHNGHMNQRYVQNLGIDHDESLAKAMKIANGREVVDTSGDLNDIVRGEDVLRFGKFRDTRISTLPDSYLTFVAEGAEVTDKDKGYTLFLANDIQRKLAIEEAVKRGIYVEHEGKMMPVKLRDYLVKWNSGWGHHFPERSKQILDLECIKTTFYDTAYGTIWIEVYQDANGNKYEYKGGTPPSCYLQDSNHRESIKKGDCFTARATVKLGHYNGNEVTYLQRIKVTTYNGEQAIK